MPTTKAAYGWDYPAFTIPPDVKRRWEAMGERGTALHRAWADQLAAQPAAPRRAFAAAMAGQLPAALPSRLRALKKQVRRRTGKVATRKSSEIALEVINATVAETLGGSADLTGSNLTRTKDLGIFSPENRKGRHLHYGIREHGMAAAMNGMMLHGGIRPYGGTFMCFNRLRPPRDAPVGADGPGRRLCDDA